MTISIALPVAGETAVCQTTISRKRFKFSPSFYHETGAYNITARSFTITQRLYSYKFILVDKTVLSSARLLSVARTPFSNVESMRTRSLVPKPKTTVIGLGARLLYVKSRVEYGWYVHDPFGSSRNSCQGLCRR